MYDSTKVRSRRLTHSMTRQIYREREDARDAKIMPATFRSTQQKPKERAERLDHELERAIYGSWRRGKGLKKDGLMKKVCSLFAEADIDLT
jgi:hypothetical protein